MTWTYGDVTPETVKVILEYSVLGQPYPNASRYIQTKWQDDVIVATANIHPTDTNKIKPLSKQDVIDQIDREFDREWGKDLPELDWEIKLEDNDTLDFPLWRIVIKIL